MKKSKLIRVTTVLSWIDSAWLQYWYRSIGFEAADKITEESSAFGTRVHKKIEQVLKGEETLHIESEIPEDQCAIEILIYLEQNGIKPLFDMENSLEIKVEDKKLGLIGHFDYLARVNGEPCIIDFKTSGKMRKTFVLQKAAYAKLANKQLGIKIDIGLTIRSHWNPETKQVEFEAKLYDNLIKKYWKIFKYCLDVYKYFNRKEK